MYTWGYIKDVSLAKLDLDEDEATIQNLISRFPFYANEVITQVCSSIKPKYAFARFTIGKNDVGQPKKMPDDFVSFGDDVCYQIVINGKFCPPFNCDCFDDETDSKHYYHADKMELHDDDFEYYGYNEVMFKHTGEFYISYNARWFLFDKNIDDEYEIDVPYDILDCIPSYIASQCYKIDDEYKAQVFRNEYEIMLSRIDATNYKNTKTIKIGGDW